MQLSSRLPKKLSPFLTFGVAIVFLLVLDAALIQVLITRTEHFFRLNFQETAELMAQTLPLEEIRALEGRPEDVHKPVYERLKAQFKALQKSVPDCRFIYLLGRRADGRLFFFLDGEPPESPDYSPPGQVFSEAQPGFYQVFDRWMPLVTGPNTDRWGTWVTALVPLNAGRKDGVPVVLALDWDASDWKRRVFREAMLPVIVFTLAVLIFLGFCLGLFKHRMKLGLKAPAWMDYLESGIVVGCGFILTGLVAWLAHQAEGRNRQQVFQHWATIRMAALAKALDNVVNVELEGLGRFFEGSESVTWQEFQLFAGYLTRHGGVQAWGWMPAIPPARQFPFEQAMRAEGFTNFWIWQLDEAGQQVPATGRDIFYPVTFLAPWSGNQRAQGFDAGSHPVRRRAMEQAEHSGWATATDVVALIHDREHQQGMVIYRPVYAEKPSGTLSGFAFAALRLKDFLQQVVTDRLVPLEWYILGTPHGTGKTAISISPDAQQPCLVYSCSVLAAGRVHELRALGLETFEKLYPKRAGIMTMVAGVFLSGALGVLVGLVRRYEARLELEVAERTRELRESEETFRKLFEDSADPIMLLKQGRFVGCNKATLRLLQASDSSQLLGRTPQDISPSRQPDGRNSAAAALEYMQRAEAEGGCRFEWEVRRLDGQSLLVDVSLVPIVVKGEKHLYATWRDITERKKAELERERLQTQLIQAQKMELVGRLAGGVAHDFNNMLHVILNYTELTREDLPPHHPLQENLKEIKDAAQRSADLTRKLLGFARQQTISPRVLNLNESVQAMQKTLQRLMGEEVRLVCVPGPNLWPVKMDPLQLDQVLANLCVNARDAIAGVGTVTIETHNVTVDAAAAAQMEDCLPGDYVMLSVRDTGCGMTPEVKARIFEPFFTTKEVGKGTGLGLAMVYGVVQQNHGFIHVESQPGQGSCFRLYFPRHQGAAEVSSAPAGIKSRPEMGHETVLLVEDEAAVWRVVKTKLERLGYRVLVAGSPADALQLAEQARNGIDLLLTDVVMPGMNGRELYQTLLKHHPRLKCLYMSGYNANVIVERGVVEKGIHFLPKPFNLYTLSVKLREVLDGPPVDSSRPD
ncbi:MAG: CHASE domain-containing protein [Verrucomicrobiae bacterium]|nr:CHASE domain-containing protein [Verrucomicrobiae bacterium]